MNNIDVIILAGGLGTRLQNVLKNIPKCLVKINGIPFIDILVHQLVNQGFRRIIVSIGYKKEQIIQHLKYYNNCEIIFSEEESPLGTGGAIKHAKKYIKSKNFFVINGDTYIDVDFFKLYTSHINKRSLVTIAGTISKSRSDYGTISIDNTDRIISFIEKSPHLISHNYISTGIYVFNYKTFYSFPLKEKFSIENDYFENLKDHNFYLFKLESDLYDIGTPERLLIFEDYLKSIDG